MLNSVRTNTLPILLEIARLQRTLIKKEINRTAYFVTENTCGLERYHNINANYGKDIVWKQT